MLWLWNIGLIDLICDVKQRLKAHESIPQRYYIVSRRQYGLRYVLRQITIKVLANFTQEI